MVSWFYFLLTLCFTPGPMDSSLGSVLAGASRESSVGGEPALGTEGRPALVLPSDFVPVCPSRLICRQLGLLRRGLLDSCWLRTAGARPFRVRMKPGTSSH